MNQERLERLAKSLIDWTGFTFGKADGAALIFKRHSVLREFLGRYDLRSEEEYEVTSKAKEILLERGRLISPLLIASKKIKKLRKPRRYG